jgi:hypothetical protein
MMTDQRRIDADHVRLLAIFHFIGAGLALVGNLFLFFDFMIIQGVFSNPQMWQNQKMGPPPAQFLAMFKWFYVVFGVWLLVSGILNLISGFFLLGRKHRTFSLVVGGINCVHVPLGTTLGVFTIIVLTRNSVRELYNPCPFFAALATLPLLAHWRHGVRKSFGTLKSQI